MSLTKPIIDISPSLHGAVLTVLVDYLHGQPLSGRQIAKKIPDRGSQEGVRRVLQALVEAGVVRRSDHPPTALYSLNEDHLAVPHLLALHGLREELFGRMRALITTWAIQPVSAVVFGSVARGEAHERSDIDVLLVRDPDVAYADGTWPQQFGELCDRTLAWSGRPVGLIDYTTDDWRGSLEIADPLLDEIHRDGVTLVGLTPRELSTRVGEKLGERQ
jgi:predicted nucleotidyltransferase